MTQTYKNGFDEKEKRTEMQKDNESRKQKDKSSKERWSTCPSKKVATVHPNPSSSIGQCSTRIVSKQNDESNGPRQTNSRSDFPVRSPSHSRHAKSSSQDISSAQSNFLFVKPSGQATTVVKPSSQVPKIVVKPSSQAPNNIKPSSQAPKNVKQNPKAPKIAKPISQTPGIVALSDPTPKSVNNNEDSEDGDSQSVSGRPRRSRGRSLLERNPDFLVDVSSRRSSVDSSKESTPTPRPDDSMKISDTLTIKWSAKSEKLSGSIVVPKTDAKVPSSSTKPTKTDKSPKRGRPQASKSPEKRPQALRSPEKRPQATQERPQSTPSKRSRSISEEVEASPRPKR